MDKSMDGADSHVLSLGETLLVADNIDTGTTGNSLDGIGRLTKQFPMRLTTACMVIVLKGSVSFGVNFQEIVAADDTCVIIREGTIVERMEYEPDARFIFLSFPQEILSAPAVTGQRSIQRLFVKQAMVMRLLPQHIEMLKSVYQMLRTVMADEAFAPNREATVGSCLDLMINVVLQASDGLQDSPDKATRQDEIVARFMQCVADNYRVHRDLGFYAERLDLSLKYMSHVVYKQTGRHPSHWIRDHVILDAKTMLRSGRYSVQQVADELNFPNQSFFGKYFKEAVGLPPKKWKSQ